MATTTATRYVYDFADGSRDMRVLLGGKGANIAEMTRVLGADLVPAGFTITTEACVAFMRDGRVEPAGLAEQVAEGIARLEQRAGRRLGDPDDPLLVSVRSGARDSMPGMLETILDLGLNDESVLGLAERTDNAHFAWDSYRRFVQMFGNVVRGVPGERYEEILSAARRRAGVREDRGLSVAQLQDVTNRFRTLYEAHTGEPLPAGPAGAAAARDPGRLRLLARRPRGRLPPHQPHPRRLGHGGQRPADGLRQPRRRLGHRRRLLARRGDRRARAERRLPARRPGRGRRLRRAHAAAAARARRGAARVARAAARDPAHARGALRRHAGHRVHRRARPALHAADAQRQAPGAGRRALRGRRRRRGPAHARAGAAHDRRRRARRAAASDVRPRGALRGARARRRRLAGRGQGRDRLHRRGGGRGAPPTAAT